MSQRTDLPDLPLLEAAKRLRAREVSSVELLDATLARLDQLEPTLNAFITVMADDARVSAQQADVELAAGLDRGPLHGIPLSVKDLFDTAGVRTTSGSRILADNVPTEDATIVAKLRDAGAVIFGKNNMLEFAYATVHPDHGPTPNPWNLAYSSSGSSSGSAVAVAAGIGYGSIGSDTGGSIRLPAAYTGTVGLKPTYGRVSRSGVMPLSTSCDHVGPMTRTAADSAALLTAIAGADPNDPTSGHAPVPDYAALLDIDLRRLRIGYHPAYLREKVEPEALGLIEAALAELEREGATLIELDLPAPAEVVPTLMGLIMPEATAIHRRWLAERAADYSSAVRERLEMAVATPATDYIQARWDQARITGRFAAELSRVDVMLTPTAPSAATPSDSDLTGSDSADAELLAALINFTGPFNLTGFPAISVPCGFSAAGLPVGLQFVAGPYQEERLLAVAHAYERAHDWHRALPKALQMSLPRTDA